MKTINKPAGADDQIEVPDLTTVKADWSMSGPQQVVPSAVSGSFAPLSNQPVQTGTPDLLAANGAQATTGSPYYSVDANEEDDPFGLNQVGSPSGMFAPPIQLTGAHPPIVAAPVPGNVPQWSAPLMPVSPASIPTHRTPSKGKRAFVLKVIGAILVIVVGMGFLGMTLFASSTPSAPHQNTAQVTSVPPSSQKTTVTKSQPTPHPTPSPTATNQSASPWLPKQLPAGWAAAGLNEGDELFAMRTAMTFTDREMSIDYRSVGTAGNHGGTLTAAMFLLTPAAQKRFLTNDLRETATFFTMVTSEELVQVVINAQPQQVSLATQDGHLFAVVTVTFNLWQYMGLVEQGEQLDPVTGQPVLHQMSILLLREQPGSQGPNAAMGGTGWLVSDYSLDQGQASIVEPA